MTPKAERIATALKNQPRLLLEVLEALGATPRCEYPGCPEKVAASPTPSMTAYSWDGEGEDPNRDLLLCEEHAQEHVEQMRAQWEEYWSGLL